MLKSICELFSFSVLMVVLICAALFLGGCADSSSTGSTVEREYDVTINAKAEGNGDVIIYTPLRVDNEQEQLLAQETKNTADVSPETTAALSKEGATGSAIKEGGEVALDGVKNIVEKLNKTKTDSENPVDNSNNSDNRQNVPDPPPVVEHHEG